MLKTKIVRAFNDVVSLLYPEFCPGCFEALEQNENTICTKCRIEIPRTNFIPGESNQIEKHFWGKVKIENAVVFCQFHKNSKVMNLLHELKYKGNQSVGELLGRMFASEYKDMNFFEPISVIIPVPLHKTKLKSRGYNQCHSICKGISEITGISVNLGVLSRAKANESQTRKGRFERYANTKDIFVLNEKKSKSTHVLLVDDVITTGSTIEACARLLVNAGCVVSVAAMASPID